MTHFLTDRVSLKSKMKGEVMKCLHSIDEMCANCDGVTPQRVDDLCRLCGVPTLGTEFCESCREFERRIAKRTIYTAKLNEIVKSQSGDPMSDREAEGLYELALEMAAKLDRQ